MSTACPTPAKIAYRFKAAKQALRRMQEQRRDDGRITVYRCPSNTHWHIGHVGPKPRKAAASKASAS